MVRAASICIAEDCLPRGILGLNRDLFRDYVQHIADRRLERIGLTPQFGWSVEVDHGNGISTRYAHAYRLWVRAGDKVSAGQKIAEVGSTGKSTGPHLHFEVRYNGTPLNPLRYLASR